MCLFSVFDPKSRRKLFYPLEYLHKDSVLLLFNSNLTLMNNS